jgi:hypothetical protein
MEKSEFSIPPFGDESAAGETVTCEISALRSSEFGGGRLVGTNSGDGLAERDWGRLRLAGITLKRLCIDPIADASSEARPGESCISLTKSGILRTGTASIMTEFALTVDSLFVKNAGSVAQSKVTKLLGSSELIPLTSSSRAGPCVITIFVGL